MSKSIPLMEAADKLEEHLRDQNVSISIGFDPDREILILYWHGRHCPQYPATIDGFKVEAKKTNKPRPA